MQGEPSDVLCLVILLCRLSQHFGRLPVNCFYFAGLIPIHGLVVKISLVVVEIQVFAA